MTRSLTNSIHIDAPVGKVFACVMDPSNFNQLMPDVTFSDVSLTPDGVGTTYRFETRVAGRPIRGRGEYTEFTPDRHIHDDNRRDCDAGRLHSIGSLVRSSDAAPALCSGTRPGRHSLLTCRIAGGGRTPPCAPTVSRVG